MKGYGYIVMKKGLKIVFAVLMTALVIALSVVSAFAAESDSSSKGRIKVKKGDKVKYVLKLGDCKDKIEGIQMYVFYDKSCLDVDEDSLDFPELKGVVKNANYPDGIAFNWTSVSDLADFSKRKRLMVVEFTAIRPADTDISYFISELYKGDKEMTSIDKYTLLCSASVNGKKVIDNETPLLSKNTELNNKYQGSFVNYADGKGPKNGSGKDHVQVTGVTTKPVIGEATEVTDVTKGEETPVTTIIVILAIVAAVIAIVILVILRRHFASDDEDNESGEKNSK